MCQWIIPAIIIISAVILAIYQQIEKEDYKTLGIIIFVIVCFITYGILMSINNKRKLRTYEKIILVVPTIVVAFMGSLIVGELFNLTGIFFVISSIYSVVVGLSFALSDLSDTKK